MADPTRPSADSRSAAIAPGERPGTVLIGGRLFRIGSTYECGPHGPVTLLSAEAPSDDGDFGCPGGLVHWRGTFGRYVAGPAWWIENVGGEIGP